MFVYCLVGWFYCRTCLLSIFELSSECAFTTNFVELNICRVLKISRPFIQFSLLILAFWISLTRISDYFHHPLDVAVGE